MRATILDAEFVPVRTVTLPFQLYNPLVHRWPDRIVGSGGIPTEASIGWPLHVVSFGGSVAQLIRSFGAGDGERRPTASRSELHFMVPGGRGTFWTAWRYAYDLSEWSAAGAHLRLLTRRPRWFADTAEHDLGWTDRPPPPHVAGMHSDSEGLLWVYVAIPGPRWREAWPAIPAGTREFEIKRIDIKKLFSTMVEVIDPVAGRVLARRRIDDLLVGVLGARIALYRESANGEPQIEILRVDLRRN